MTTKEFIAQNRESDVRQLALQGNKYPEVNMPFALNQIQGWQTAKKKLPSLSAVDGIIYPPHLNMEQCSSETTARYKSSLLLSLSLNSQNPMCEGSNFHSSMVDLTGGLGIDFSFLSRGFKKATYVERNTELCEIARHNFGLLGLDNTKVVCEDAVEYLHSMKPVDFIYIDPARRDSKGGRTYAIEDCTPNVIELQDLLLEKAQVVMIKLSPMLDWHKTVQVLKHVAQVHIVSVQNECKELLVLLEKEGSKNRQITIHCMNDDQHFSAYEKKDLLKTAIEGVPKQGQWLLVPNSSIMKAGVFASLSSQFGICQIATNSHLFTSDKTVENFPGRQFLIKGIFSMNKKGLKDLVSTLTNENSQPVSANISARNFPLTPEQLRKKLKLKDGGKDFIFATTDNNGKHILLLCV